jgi:hypothetical protein
MKVSIHSLRWENNDPRIVDSQRKVFDHFGIPLQITEKNIHHMVWMDSIFNNVDADIYVFFDGDCVPISYDALSESIKFCESGYLVGNAQVTNCINAKHDLFCGASFLAVSRDYYNDIGRPSAMQNSETRCDGAQQITRNAVHHEKRIKMWFPTTFQTVPNGGIWRLSSYGYYGVGTVYDNKTYHLFQSRLSKNVDLFVETCTHIVNDRPDLINRQYDCRSEYSGILPIEDDYGY